MIKFKPVTKTKSRKGGRPKKAHALTAAERQRKRRGKLKKTDAEWLAETVGADG